MSIKTKMSGRTIGPLAIVSSFLQIVEQLRLPKLPKGFREIDLGEPLRRAARSKTRTRGLLQKLSRELVLLVLLVDRVWRPPRPERSSVKELRQFRLSADRHLSRLQNRRVRLGH